MRWRIPRPATLSLIALGLANIWLVAIVLDELRQTSQTEPLPTISGNTKKHELPDNGAFPTKPMGVYHMTLAQPVFFKSRSPYVPPPPDLAQPVVVPQAVIVDPGLALSGVIINEDLKKAYVSARGEDEGKWVAEGENISGWTVQMIAPASVTLTQSGRSIELNLYPKQ